MTGKYDDIIGLPHHQSETRPHMSMQNRAAQFNPFATLPGYGDMVKQTAQQNELSFEPVYDDEIEQE